VISLLELPRGGEWLVILAVVVLLFGPAKLPALVRQLGRSKKIWDEEIAPGKQTSGDAPQELQAAEQAAPRPDPAVNPSAPQADGHPAGDSAPPSQATI